MSEKIEKPNAWSLRFTTRQFGTDHEFEIVYPDPAGSLPLSRSEIRKGHKDVHKDNRVVSISRRLYTPPIN